MNSSVDREENRLILKNKFLEMRPEGGYKVIFADPPWAYRVWSDNGSKKLAQNHYSCMNLEDMASLPVNYLAADDCVLFMWATWPLMTQWNRIIEAWGFEFKALAWEWIKYNEKTGKYAFGLGYGTRKNLEPCLLASRGKPSLKKAAGARSVRDFIIQSPGDCIREKRREHSRKPDEGFTRIEAMFDGPYIELFAREKRTGWSAWGNEIDKFNRDD